MERPRPIINLRIPVAMIEQKLESIRSQIAGKDTDLVAQLAASLAVRKISIPDANCRVGKSYRPEAPQAAGRQTQGREGAAVVHAAAASRTRQTIVCENADAGVASILSPSQTRTYRDCSARWYFKYMLNLPEAKTGNMAVGTAVHDSIAYNLAQKIESGKDLAVGDIENHIDTAWEAVLSETELREDEDASALLATGKQLAVKYLRDEAPSIHPIAVEKELAGVVGGVPVHGFADVIETCGRIRDIKTAKARPNGIDPAHMFQLATYAQLAPGATGEVRVDTLVKTKAPQLITHTHMLTELDYLETQTIYPLVQEAMQGGIYVPNRNSMMCSRRNCGHWRACEQEYGGKVSLT